ncbi:MAG: fluoride efflux transporter CrcB [Silicimonas sp.]|nr:fluoride efflux transporter CrcB [Silicimonas sp.]
MTLIYVAIGGALGAVLRYLTSLAVAFPLGTLTVNVLGSFLMGLAFVFLMSRGADRAALFVMTGVLGGFTTFSAFSLDALRLFERGAAGQAGLYVLASVVMSILALGLGVWLARSVA